RTTDSLMISAELLDQTNQSFGPLVVPQLAATRCIHAMSDRATELARIQSLSRLPGGLAVWSVSSAPTDTQPSAGSLPIADSTPPAADDSLDVHYGSPYTGEVDLFAYGTQVPRQLFGPSATKASPILFGSSGIVVIPPSDASHCPAVAPPHAAA